MSLELIYPSVSEIRSKLILQKINHLHNDVGSINIFATGKTTVGKTTLGNRLIGEEYFLCTGHQNTTKVVNLVEFPSGFRYVDLPGVDSDDRLENYNRAALGLKQVESFPLVKELTLAKYREELQPQEQNLTLSDFDNIQLKPDLIFYLIAPQKHFSRSEIAYLWDLLEHHQQVVYIFNLFVDQQTKDSYSVTSQNIEDVESIIRDVHTDVLGNSSQPTIAKVNCLTGEGIFDLLARSHEVLGGHKGKIFEEVISYQQHNTADEYARQIKPELLKIVAHAACQKPDGISNSSQTLLETCQLLWDFLGKAVTIPVQKKEIHWEKRKSRFWQWLLGDKKRFVPKTVMKSIKDVAVYPKVMLNNLVQEIASNCTEDHYENVMVEKSKDIYKSVARYKKVKKKVTDYDNPIIEQRVGYRNPDDIFEGIGNFFQHDSWKTRYYYDVTVGYHTKTVKRKVFDKYEDVYSHTETWLEDTGERKKIGSTYHYFRQHGVILLLTLTHLMTSYKFVQCKNQSDLEIRYRTLQKSISSRVNKLDSFTNIPKMSSVLKLLESRIDLLFEDSFDQAIKKNI